MELEVCFEFEPIFVRFGSACCLAVGLEVFFGKGVNLGFHSDQTFHVVLHNFCNCVEIGCFDFEFVFVPLSSNNGDEDVSENSDHGMFGFDFIFIDVIDDLLSVHFGNGLGLGKGSDGFKVSDTIFFVALFFDHIWQNSEHSSLEGSKFDDFLSICRYHRFHGGSGVRTCETSFFPEISEPSGDGFNF